MIEDIKQDSSTRMAKSIEALNSELLKIRTGRAHISLLDHVKVDYYGNIVPINQAATVSVADARTLAVQPWEKTMLQAIEKAIMTSDLGLNPSTQGETIRVPLPVLTEERRKDMTKIVRHEAENCRVAIRNIRRDANSHIKDFLKEKDISEDDARRGEDDVQKITNKFVAEVEVILAAKEKELMAI